MEMMKKKRKRQEEIAADITAKITHVRGGRHVWPVLADREFGIPFGTLAARLLGKKIKNKKNLLLTLYSKTLHKQIGYAISRHEIADLGFPPPFSRE